MVTATEAIPSHQAFYFKGSGLPLSVSGSLSHSICKGHIALQEHQIGFMILHRMAFQLSGKVVTLYLDNSTANIIKVVTIILP